ncbi:MAG: hypothetical protein QXU64_01720 [Thermofilaceae archaeon]
MQGKKDIPVKDFLEEHKKLKGTNPLASPAASQPAAPQAPTALPASPQPPQPTAARPQEFITRLPSWLNR